MKCPYCGGEMEEGTLDSMDRVFWTRSGQEKPTLRSLLSWEGIKSLCAPLETIAFRTDEGWATMAPWVPARHCPKCGIFLFRGRFVQEE